MGEVYVSHVHRYLSTVARCAFHEKGKEWCVAWSDQRLDGDQ